MQKVPDKRVAADVIFYYEFLYNLQVVIYNFFNQ